jgi:hypothetical protein
MGRVRISSADSFDPRTCTRRMTWAPSTWDSFSCRRPAGLTGSRGRSSTTSRPATRSVSASSATRAMFVNEVAPLPARPRQLHGWGRATTRAGSVPVLRVLRVPVSAPSPRGPPPTSRTFDAAPHIAGVLVDAADASGKSGGLGSSRSTALDALRRSLPEGADLPLRWLTPGRRLPSAHHPPLGRRRLERRRVGAGRQDRSAWRRS